MEGRPTQRPSVREDFFFLKLSLQSETSESKNRIIDNAASPYPFGRTDSCCGVTFRSTHAAYIYIYGRMHFSVLLKKKHSSCGCILVLSKRLNRLHTLTAPGRLAKLSARDIHICHIRRRAIFELLLHSLKPTSACLPYVYKKACSVTGLPPTPYVSRAPFCHYYAPSKMTPTPTRGRGKSARRRRDRVPLSTIRDLCLCKLTKKKTEHKNNTRPNAKTQTQKKHQQGERVLF